MTHPAFVYRIIDKGALCGALSGEVVPYATADHRDGFFHLSTFDQLLETAQRYFKDAPSVLALKIRFEDIAATTKFESAEQHGNDHYPHLYGNLATTSVIGVLTLTRRDDGAFCLTQSRPI